MDASDAAVRRAVRRALASVPNGYVWADRRTYGPLRDYFGQFGRGAGMAFLLND